MRADREKWLTLAAFAVAPFMILSNWIFARKIHARTLESKQADAEITSFIQQSMATVALTQRTVSRPDGETVTLAHRAEGRRPGSGACEAFCTSTYRLRHGAWKLIQHQQTPIHRGRPARHLPSHG